uniref:Uncharacterized protein n=1 Tax=Phlebotomus papatasi TaxID=29031 RepID=A0A1B0EZC4_PHLPP
MDYCGFGARKSAFKIAEIAKDSVTNSTTTKSRLRISRKRHSSKRSSRVQGKMTKSVPDF